MLAEVMAAWTSRGARVVLAGRCFWQQERQASPSLCGVQGCLYQYWRARSLGTQVKRKVRVKDGMSVVELARALGATSTHVRTVLRESGQRSGKSSANLPLGVCEMVVKEMGHTPVLPVYTEAVRDPASFCPRPPVVTVMGHVDHGKTTLLDSLRRTSVAAGEPGGITQHIGAFSVVLDAGHRITFLDTPGHAAFTAMRARGANITDIVVLVVAADDGIMTQTIECIELVQQARVPVVVAINKCDKKGVDVARVKRELLQHGVQLEEFGGDVQVVEISALKGTGLATLEEAIAVLAEVCDLRADPVGPVEGTVIESRVDKGLGAVATVLVQHGTLRPGHMLVGGTVWGKVRKMVAEGKEAVLEAPPSTPVLTVGWRDVPMAGDRCLQVESEQVARRVLRERAVVAERQEALVRPGEEEVVPLVVKGDVAGSVEAVVGLLSSRQPRQVGIRVIHSGIGPVSETDIELAASTKGLVLAFNVSCNKAIASLATQRHVTVLSHNVIYKLVELLKSELESGLPTVWEEEVLGEAIVLKVFRLTGAKAAAVGGCRVKQGRLVRSGLFRVIRDREVVHEGAVTGMKHGKENISTARKETECGISFSSDPGFMEGDTIVCYTRKQSQQKLDWDLGF